MRIWLEIPDSVAKCERHSFNADTFLCKCGLHMNLSIILPDDISSHIIEEVNAN